MWYFGSWMFPVLSACMWLATLLTLLIRWLTLGRPIYPSMEHGQTIAYISDTGAYGLKPLFITGCAITTVSLDLGFMAERWLRHTGRLVPNTSFAQKVLSVLAIIFAVAGSAGLILLSVFDTYRHSRMHNGFLLLFIAGFIFSAAFLCAEYQRLGIHYREHRVLRISFWVKLVFILIEVALAIAFGVTMYTERRNSAAVIEWIIAFVFTGFLLSFLLDLLPSVRCSKHVPQGWRNGGPGGDVEKNRREMGLVNGHANGNGDGSTAPLGEPFTLDSQGPNADGADFVGGGYRGTEGTSGWFGRQKRWFGGRS